ncbi:exonuclease 1 isoform X1 [Lactuca sativa]|nr:exonuclease 1 isoform X1 [Lactuca sativa]
MGIQGLLPLLKSVMAPIHIKDLEGCSVAVDTYSWLHKGALSCSMDLCKSQPTSKHVDYCMHRVNLLRHYGVKPILVFDGGHLPMKNEQEIKRARSRKENLARAIEHESCGNTSAAYECYQKAVDISPTIAYELIQVLKQEQISYVVAPYEADAQMTFLALSKHVDAVITEDSDLIPFGCPRIIYKMDKFGQGVEFQYSRLQHTKDLNLSGFTKQMILEMCILSGCDYLQSLPGMGLKKAHALIKKFKTHEKVIKHLKFSAIVVPPLYEESFRRAILTFLHQRVYDPITEDIVHLSDLPDNIDEDLDFLGPSIPKNLAKGIASGDIDPFTKLSIQGECVKVKPGPLLDKTYDLKSFKSGDTVKKLDLPAQKNLLTNYFCFATLEAKRKFMAPRISPKHPNEIPQMDKNEEIVDKIPARKTSMLLESLSHDNMRKVQHSKHPIHPCIASQKESESNSSIDGIEGKTRVQKKPIIVRSSYFQHKNLEENNQENTKMNDSKDDDDDDVAVASKNTCSDGVHVSVFHAPEVKTRVENRKMITSRYFSQKNQENTNEKSTIKRKFSISEDSVQKENLNQKFMRPNPSSPNQGDKEYDDKIEVTRDEEEKFGCNISHLGKYSEIAEKSMDKFISVISSFKCTSSGSRASGLRAPLKDMRNTCSKNSSSYSIDDISKFAYKSSTKTLP